jgi:hypothetical protein
MMITMLSRAAKTARDLTIGSRAREQPFVRHDQGAGHLGMTAHFNAGQFAVRSNG